MGSESSRTDGSSLEIEPEALDAFFGIAEKGWEIWKNHISTVMPSVDFAILSRGKSQAFSRISIVFHVFCTSQRRIVSLIGKGSGRPITNEYSCPPLALALYPDSKAGPMMRTPAMVLAERTGTSDELAFAFHSAMEQLGAECMFSLVFLRSSHMHRFALLVDSASGVFFIDLADSLLIQLDDSQMAQLQRHAESHTLHTIASSISDFLLAATLGIAKGPPTGLLDVIYASFPDAPHWEIAGIIRGHDAIEMFWHYQSARRLSLPIVGADIAELVRSNPDSLSRLLHRTGGDFSQVILELESASRIYNSLDESQQKELAQYGTAISKMLAVLIEAKEKKADS